MTFIGDLNGDGVLDMAVGADGDDDGKARSGAVYVLVKTLSSWKSIKRASGRMTIYLFTVYANLKLEFPQAT